MNETIRDFLVQPDALETALEIEAQLPNIKKWLFQTFWEQVGDELQRRLAAGGHDQLWVVQLDDDIFQLWCGFQISWQKAKEFPHFAVRAECLTGKGDWAFYGIHRGIEIESEDQMHVSESNLKTRLSADGFERRSWWPGCRYFHQRQLPQFKFPCADDLILMSQDLQDFGRPLTRRVAEQIWQVFEAYHTDLEALNRAYPYACE